MLRYAAISGGGVGVSGFRIRRRRLELEEAGITVSGSIRTVATVDWSHDCPQSGGDQQPSPSIEKSTVMLEFWLASSFLAKCSFF